MKTSTRTSLTAVVCVLLIALVSGAAFAVPVEFEFGGTIDYVYDPFDALSAPWDVVNVGDNWSIKYTFESTTPDSHAPVTVGEYRAISSYELTIGAANESAAVNPLSTFIRVFDSQPVNADQYEVSIPLQNNLFWFMQLDQLNTNTPFTSDALPLCGDIDLADFTTVKDMTIYDFGGFGSEIHGQVTYHNCSQIPEPSSIALATLGLIAIGYRVRKRA